MTGMKTLLCILIVSAVALSGCTAENSIDGQSASYGGGGKASLSFNGYGSGTKSATADCGTDGTLSIGTNMGGGSLTVTVTDGSGATVYQKSISTMGQKSVTERIDGSAGAWRVTAQRGAAFSGQYGIDLTC